jgi:CBS domain-containing protein
VHCLVVPPSRAGACVGVITVKDIVQIMSDGEGNVLDQLLVADAMSAPAVSVQHAFTIADCLKLMRIAGVRSAPVLDGVRLVGLLSFTDVLRAAAVETSEASPVAPAV